MPVPLEAVPPTHCGCACPSPEPLTWKGSAQAINSVVAMRRAADDERDRRFQIGNLSQSRPDSRSMMPRATRTGIDLLNGTAHDLEFIAGRDGTREAGVLLR